MSFGFGFGFPSWRTLAGGFSPAALFVGGVQGAWYDPSDLSTMFDTSAGTTPVAMPGQGAAVPVGLMLDKSQNGVGTNGAYRYNLLTYSQAFGNAAWVTASATKVSTTQTDPNGGSTAALITIASGGEFYQDVTLTGGSGSFSVYVKKPTTGGATAIRLTTNNRVAWNTGLSTKVTLTPDWQRVVLSGALVSSGSFLRVDITCRDATSAIDTDCIGDVLVAFAQLETSLTASTYQHIDATWYGAIPGNHAIAANDSTKRPVLMARVNLLTYSEEFSNAYWIKSNSTITANSTTAPNGSTTADTITETATTAGHGFSSGLFSFVSGVAYTISVHAKNAPNGRGFIQLAGFGIGAAGATVYANFDLVNEAVTAQVGGTGAIQSVGDNWYFCSFTFTCGTSASERYNAYLITSGAAAAFQSYAGDITKSLYIWGADLRPANIGANVPAYQRIADALTYDTSGFPLYLFFTTDDSMYTPANLNLSGTDKVAVFAGVRKLSDAAAAILYEFSNNWNGNTGSFASAAPASTGASGDYNAAARGSASASGTLIATSAITLAPVTNVFTATHDIPGDLSAIRLNGAASGTNGTGDKGSGNFGTYPLFIGARNNGSFWFNGQVYGLLVVGSAVSAGNISATEQWVAGKTGIQI